MEATADALAMPVARCWKGVSAVSCVEEVGVRRGELREGRNKLANGAVSTNPRTLPARRAARNAMDSWMELSRLCPVFIRKHEEAVPAL